MAVQLLQAMARQAKRNKRCRPAARAAARISRPTGIRDARRSAPSAVMVAEL